MNSSTGIQLWDHGPKQGDSEGTPQAQGCPSSFSPMPLQCGRWSASDASPFSNCGLPASVVPLSSTVYLATMVVLPQHNPGTPRLFSPVFLQLASQHPHAGHDQQGLVEWIPPPHRPHLSPLTPRLQTRSLFRSSTAPSHLSPLGPAPATLSP